MSDKIEATRIRLRPRHDVMHISRGRTVLCMDLHGSISPDNARQGLYVYQTRMLSKYVWTIEGRQPQLSTQSPVDQHTWLAYYYQAPPNCKETPTGECNPLQETIELKLSRVVGEGLHEDVEVTNHTQIKTSVTLALEVDADFASRSEIKNKRKQDGTLQTRWEKDKHKHKDKDHGHASRWSFDYHSEHHYDRQGNRGDAQLHRGIELHLHSDSEAAHPSATKISFSIELQPHQTWKACLKWQAQVDGNVLPVEPKCNALTSSDGEWFRKRESFLTDAGKVRTPAADNLTPTVQRALDRARVDLASLRLYDLDEGDHNWKLAAGIPTYLALFGRDMLIASWQASMVSTDMSRGALTLNARLQCHDTNDWRDAQPGRMLHESHTDPVSVLNFTPESLYFGTANAPFLYAILAGELWHWTGDKELVRGFVKPALATLAWADKSLRDESGFYKYNTRSEQGNKNQGWKDSGDAIVYADGSQVEDPLGTCEMQAYAYAAKLHFSELLIALGDETQARRLYREAEELKKRFNDRFWMDNEHYFGMAIDKDDKLVESVSSDAGHCLLWGIIDDERAPRVADRMLQPDLFSGWGVRTLSTKHPAFNPFSYHRGSVWPVENGIFVAAMARYGLHDKMWRLAKALFDSASLFEYDRLPEVFGGHARDESHPFPCLYETADFPQAWSASAAFIAIQALLGIYPYAPLGALLVDPWLPDWLPEVTVEDLRVGSARVSLRFKRDANGKTKHEVIRLDGEIRVLHQPNPWSLSANWGEQVRERVTSLLSAA